MAQHYYCKSRCFTHHIHFFTYREFRKKKMRTYERDLSEGFITGWELFWPRSKGITSSMQLNG